MIIDLSSRSTIAAILYRSASEAPGDQFGDKLMRYRAPNGRRFNVYRADGMFYLCESTPNGLRKQYGPGGSPAFAVDERIQEVLKEKDPNGFQHRLQELGYSDRDVVRTYELLSRDMIDFFPCYDNLDHVIDEIQNAIDNNVWLELDFLNPNHVSKVQREQEDEDAASDFFDKLTNLQSVSIKTAPEMFQGLFSLSGPLSKEERLQILSFLNDPSQDNWKAICNMAVKGSVNLWEAIRIVDPDAPLMDGSGWQPIPEADELRSYLREIGDYDAVRMVTELVEGHLDAEPSQDNHRSPSP